MTTISVKHDLDKLRRSIKRVQRDQIPFATSLALNMTVGQVRQGLKVRTKRDLQNPTPFTQNAFATKRSTKRDLRALVFIKRIQWEYLKFQIYGGIRRPRRRAIAIPGDDVKRNKYGNPRGRRWVNREVGRRATFSAQIGGTEGLWDRTGGVLRLRVLWARLARYRPRFKFKQTAARIVRGRFTNNFTKAWQRATRTARR